MNKLSERDLDSAEGRLPLYGTVIIDLSRALAGPIAATLLGHLDARVIKVEVPERGDDSRTWGTSFGGSEDNSQSTYFMSANRTKESVCVDLNDPEGKRLLHRLIWRADALVEDDRPGVVDRLDFGLETLRNLNPRLVLSILGFRTRRTRRRKGGLRDCRGHRRFDVGYWVAGRGPDAKRTSVVIRTSLLAAAVSAHTFHGARRTIGGEVARATGNQHPQIAPYGSYRCTDGMAQVAVDSEGLRPRFAPVVGLDPGDWRFATAALRLNNRDELTSEIEESLADVARETVLQLLSHAGVSSGVMRSIDEVYRWEQTRNQGLLIDVDDRAAGRLSLTGPPFRLEDPGQHDADIALWLDRTAIEFGEAVPTGR